MRAVLLFLELFEHCRCDGYKAYNMSSDTRIEENKSSSIRVNCELSHFNTLVAS